MRSRLTAGLVGCAVATLLIVGWPARSGSGPGAASGSAKSAAVATLTLSTVRVRASADGMAVVLSVSPSTGSTPLTVRYRVQAAVGRAHGALSYDLDYGDGTDSDPPTPQFCLGGSGAPLKATWPLRHRYETPGTYRVSVTVRAQCTPGQVTASTAIVVVSPKTARPG